MSAGVPSDERRPVSPTPIIDDLAHGDSHDQRSRSAGGIQPGPPNLRRAQGRSRSPLPIRAPGTVMPEPRTIYFGAADDKGLLFGRSRSRLPGRRRSPIRFDCSRTSSPPAPMAGCYSKRDRTQGGHVFLLTELGLARQWLGLAHRTQVPRAVPRMEYGCVLE